MIEDRIHLALKKSLVKYGDAEIFGEDSHVRRAMSEDEIVERFVKIWREVLEPEIRCAKAITLEHAREMLDERVHRYVVEGYQYREFSTDLVAFVARLNPEATKDGNCTQLWSLGAHRDPTRLCMFFNSPDDRKQFEVVAKNIQLEAKKLATELAYDFMRKFPSFRPKDSDR